MVLLNSESYPHTTNLLKSIQIITTPLPKSQLYKFICVLDFEATCDNVQYYDNEIIEFSSILLRYSKKHGNYIYVNKKEFKEYCKPKCNKTVTPFCTKLTGITQEQVDSGKDLPTVLSEHELWLKKACGKQSVIIMTVGESDLNKFLYNDYKKWNMTTIAPVYKKFIDVSYIFKKFYHTRYTGLKNMMRILNLKLIGTQHNALDDCKNTAQIILRMVTDGLQINEYMVYNVNKYIV